MGAGTGFCDDAAARAFFTPARQYRARGFVATSYNKYSAQDFIKRVRSRPTPHAYPRIGPVARACVCACVRAAYKGSP